MRIVCELTHWLPLLDLRVQERLALDDGQDQGREPVFVAGEPGDDLVDGPAIGSIEAAAEGVGQHLLGEAAGERIAARQESRLELGRTVKARPPGNRPEASIGCPPSCVRQPPMASKFSRPKPSGSMRRWHEAQAGSVRCRSIRCRSVPDAPWSLPSFSASTPDGGGDGGAPRMFSRIHLPRLTGEVRFGLDVAARTLAWVNTPPRGVPASETRRNQSPVTPAMP